MVTFTTKIKQKLKYSSYNEINTLPLDFISVSILVVIVFARCNFGKTGDIVDGISLWQFLQFTYKFAIFWSPKTPSI
jgi:hypothetical protein